MSASGLRYDRDAATGEWVMRTGPEGPFLLILPPLFEELNRTRALIAGVMRRLAEAGRACALPDLPGTGESERPLEQVGWEAWRGAVAAAARGAAATAAIRGGCLLDDAAGLERAWRFAPADGASLVRDLERSGMVSGGGGSAGYEPSPALIERLRAAKPAPIAELRTLRLASDRGEADRKIDGPSLWRRSEPQTSHELADLIASDLTAWMNRCGGF